jgi:hypothetical protein
VDLVEATTSIEVRYELPAVRAGSPRIVTGSVDGGAA